jgi:hypothetical protein
MERILVAATGTLYVVSYVAIALNAWLAPAHREFSPFYLAIAVSAASHTAIVLYHDLSRG